MLDNRISIAIQHHLRNNFQQAFELYKAALEGSPEDRHAHHLMGLLLAQNGFIEQGRQYLDRALALAPDYPEALHNRRVLDDPIRGRHQLEEGNIVRGMYGGEALVYPARQTGTVDDWRHMRMLEFTRHLANCPESWLTIGDHFGHDAQRLVAHGVADCTPSSLSTEYLEAAKAQSLVSHFLRINAEEIPLENGSFDVVVCKEALHHMPRPYQAIYEMLRVARKAVIVIEPNDTLIDWRPEGRSSPVRRDFVMDDHVGETAVYTTAAGERVSSRYVDWWEDGPNNYVYTLSEREVTKIASGYGLPCFGTLTFNDYYAAEYGGHEAREGVEGYDRTVEQIGLHDQLCQQTGIPRSYVVGAFFKQTPPQAVSDGLTSSGFTMRMTRTRFLPFAWPEVAK